MLETCVYERQEVTANECRNPAYSAPILLEFNAIPGIYGQDNNTPKDDGHMLGTHIRRSGRPTLGLGNELRKGLHPDLKFTPFFTSAQMLWHSSARPSLASERITLTASTRVAFMIARVREMRWERRAERRREKILGVRDGWNKKKMAVTSFRGQDFRGRRWSKDLSPIHGNFFNLAES